MAMTMMLDALVSGEEITIVVGDKMVRAILTRAKSRMSTESYETSFGGSYVGKLPGLQRATLDATFEIVGEVQLPKPEAKALTVALSNAFENAPPDRQARAITLDD